ncbi:MAG: HD domain-containing protein [Chthonomonadaceae bacterium]|nr:HD domain-containing protein [Chthonomonadaceae bacterium]
MVCALAGCAFYFFLSNQANVERTSGAKILAKEKQLAQSAFALTKRTNELTTASLSRWDEIASSAAQGSWTTNLNVLESSNLTGFWLYNANQKLIYSSAKDRAWPNKGMAPKPFVDPKRKRQVNSYFFVTSRGVQLISTSRVYKLSEYQENGSHSGYLVTAKLFDSTTLKSLGSSTNSQVTFVPAPSKVGTTPTLHPTNGFTVALMGAKKTTVGWLVFKPLTMLNRNPPASMATALSILLSLSLVIGGAALVFRKTFVIVPKKALSQAVRTGDSTALKKNLGSSDESNDLRALVDAHSKTTDLVSVNQTLEKIVYRRTQELEKSYGELLEALVSALELRDQETEGHSRRVTELTVILAQRMGFGPEELVHIRRGALLHDIGKIGIPDAILLKSGPLDPLERQIIGRHPEYAVEILKGIEFIAPALDIPLCHHEKWDGTGYPRGLKGEDIPLSARIFSIIDVWDALSSTRPYRQAWPENQVRAELERMSGTHFDPRVVSMMLAILDEGTAAQIRRAA